MAVNGLVRLLDVMSYRVGNVQEDVAKLDEQGETEHKTENRLCEEELVDDPEGVPPYHCSYRNASVQ